MVGREGQVELLEVLSTATTTALAAAFGARLVNGWDGIGGGERGAAMQEPSMETISGDR